MLFLRMLKGLGLLRRMYIRDASTVSRPSGAKKCKKQKNIGREGGGGGEDPVPYFPDGQNVIPHLKNNMLL